MSDVYYLYWAIPYNGLWAVAAGNRRELEKGRETTCFIEESGFVTETAAKEKAEKLNKGIK